MCAAEIGERPRLAELVGSLSLATDLAAGFAIETALHTCVLAVGLGRAVGMAEKELRDVYYTGLLRFVGCTAFAHEQAWYGAGDDQAFSRTLAPVDGARPLEVVTRIVSRLGRGSGAFARARAVTRTLTHPGAPHDFAVAHCDQAIQLARHLGMPPRVVAALGQMHERWDGRGNPSNTAGDLIEPAARVMQVAWRAEVQRALDGPATAVDVVRKRAGGELDPKLATAFVAAAPDLLATVAAPSVWDSFLAAEPAPFVRIDEENVGKVAEAFAHFVDLKSPFTLGHSIGVARLSAAAAKLSGLSVEDLRVAALLHDIGRVSVPNGIWDKTGSLNASEWDRVRLHGYQTERILSRSPLLLRFARIAGHHHERPDGSGYHRGVTEIPREARILAAADAFQAMTEDRAHRPGRDPAAVAKILADEARTGRHDRDAVEVVLAAAGQSAPPRGRGGGPAGLSEREVEVLCLLARGLSNKEIGARLFISAKTVQHHVAHIYAKTSISTRAAAALYAVSNGLVK